jgi:beta-mannosidase
MLYSNYKSRFSLLLVIFMMTGGLFAQTNENLWQPYRITPRSGNQHIDLTGKWELSFMDAPVSSVSDLSKRQDSFQTQVPNSIHMSYFKAGKLPHPYANKNSVLYRWMEGKAWYYQKGVLIPAAAKGNSILLCFDGIDYFSKIWVNDSLMGSHQGMFGGPDMDITKVAKFGGSNKIVVEVRAGNWGNIGTNIESLPRINSGELDYTNVKGFNPRATGKIIKPWIISGGSGTEAFFSVGFWRGASIEIVPEVHLERPYLTTLRVNDKEAVLHLSTEMLAGITSLKSQLHPWGNAMLHNANEKGFPFVPVKEKINLSVEFSNENSPVYAKEFPLELFQGRNWLEEDLVLGNPQLWNPNGMGDPNLYKVKLSLKKHGETIDQLSFDYGIRTIERVKTAGPRTADRWENWQFIVNGRKLFVKGMNWTPIDILLDLPKERYRWALEAAKGMGVQLIRVWGGGLLETDDFYDICNELGIMVWQDFPIGNQDTPDYPQDVWEAQVVQNIFRLRNHPSLVVWCGGNEFNPYSFGNTGSIGIIERNLDIFDKSRLFVRTSPDDGSMHAYPDMDPCWYNRSYKYEPWVAETGMHSMPESNLFYELVVNKEFFDLGKMWDKNFYKSHPEFIHHFTEYGPARVPRMLSRASHIDNMSDPTIESVTEATQIGAGEFYQLFSEKMQANYPVTTGLMPWVFKRHWPVIAIQMLDWFGQPVAPYYFLKRTYEATHISLDLERLLWAPGENIGMIGKISHSGEKPTEGVVSVKVFDDTFRACWQKEAAVMLKEGPSVTRTDLGNYQIPSGYRNRFLFIVAELKDKAGTLISRSVYYPRSLQLMEDQAFHDKYVGEPVPFVTLDKGPWLKPTVAKTQTSLKMELLANKYISGQRSQLKVKITNNGKIPAFMTKLNISGSKRAFCATDNFFWLAPGETREIVMEVLWREPVAGKKIQLLVDAWNAKRQVLDLN